MSRSLRKTLKPPGQGKGQAQTHLPPIHALAKMAGGKYILGSLPVLSSNILSMH